MSSSTRTWHRVVRVLIIVNGEQRNEHVEMRSVLDVPAGWVLSRFRHWLTNWSLHLVRIGLRLYLVEVKIQRRLINAVEVLQIGESNQPAVAKSIRLICRQLRRCRRAR